MARSNGSLFRTSSYVAGTVTGLVVALPLVAASVGAVAASRATPTVGAIELIGPTASAFQAPMINRSSKGSRLVMNVTSPVGTAGSTHARSTETRPAAAAKVEPKAPARAMQTPRGCLSAIGVTKANLATEELTVCVADASIIRSIN